MLTNKLQTKANRTGVSNDRYIPSFFRLTNSADRTELEHLLDTNNYLSVHDTMASQLKDLVKSKNPSVVLTADEITAKITEHLGSVPMAEYGVWVYYPWSEKLVHLLDEEEFVELRTNRNKYKITDEEQKLLATKKLGIVGLSVGQSVALTMAMERVFGELRIADFDELDITNLNRLRTGVHNIDLKKTVIVAREIAEIDPYLKITLFSDGLTTDTIDNFFTVGGNLDIIIDECDGLDMKIVLRQRAKALGIPVVMEASDRGTIDVERFDLEPSRPLLHGFIDHLDHTIVGKLTTNEEKIPYILPMLGIETISKRLKASMVEVKQSISTWPQLASAVVLGGALVTDVCRRMLLDQYHESGRYFVDIEEQIGDRPLRMEGVYESKEMNYPELTIEEMQHAIDRVNLKTSSATPDDLIKIAEAASLAPSAGNNQPWKLLSKDGALYLFHDKEQSYSWTDELDFIAQISLGAALENAAVKAESLGYEVVIDTFPVPENKMLIAAVFLSKTDRKSPLQALEKYIGLRCTNRNYGDRTPVESEILNQLANEAKSFDGAKLSYLTKPDDIFEFAEIESAAERLRVLHSQSHFEFFTKELKWNPTGKEIVTEGLDLKTLGMTVGEETGMKVASDPGVIALLNKWNAGKVFEKNGRAAIKTSSAIGLVSMPYYSPVNYVTGGRALERVWLLGAQYELAIHPVSAPILLHTRIKYGNTDSADANMINKINELYRKLCILFPELNDRLGVFLFRISKADETAARSLRKPIEELYNSI